MHEKLETLKRFQCLLKERKKEKKKYVEKAGQHDPRVCMSSSFV
jgi:hypothetical protein